MESQHIRIESDTKSKFEGILQEKLQELRDLYDTEAKQYRDETDNLYSSKVWLFKNVLYSVFISTGTLQYPKWQVLFLLLLLLLLLFSFMLQSTHKMANLTQNEICAVLCSKRQYKQHNGEKMAM